MKLRSKMPVLWVTWMMAALVCVTGFAGEGIARTRDKVVMQKESRALLDALDQLFVNTRNLNTLFSDQSAENVCRYARQYARVIRVLDGLENNLRDWKELVKQNSNDKVYRAYVATVQLAMYTVYSKPNEFLGFLKIYTPATEGIACAELEKKDDMPSWDLKRSEWEIKAESYLLRGAESVEKALSLDPFYDDARILKAQLSVLQKDYDGALDLLAQLESEGVFDEKRSYLNSWRAFIAIQKGDALSEEHLKRAVAFSEPPENSSWASTLMRTRRSARSLWTEFEFYDIEPPENDDLATLMADTNRAVQHLREVLGNPVASIPKSITGITMPMLIERAVTNQSMLITLESDSSRENLIRYARLFEKLYDTGLELESLMKRWDKLAVANPQVAYYYLLQKASCGILLVQMALPSRPLLDHNGLVSLLRSEQIQRQEEPVDYPTKWQEWIDLKPTLNDEIEKVLRAKSDLIPAQLLSFEYHAAFSDPKAAENRLTQLEAQLNDLKTKDLITFSDRRSVDITAYVSAWRSYLAMKSGNLKAAGEFLTQAEEHPGLDEWKRDQGRIINLKTLSQP